MSKSKHIKNGKAMMQFAQSAHKVQKEQYTVEFRTATGSTASNAVSTAMILGLSLSASIGTSAFAGSKAEQTPSKMPSVIVESSREKEGYTEEGTSMPIYSGSLSEIPQVISILPKQLMKDQGITSTREALRNVAGVSIAAGEGGNQGDNITIRGFTARSDFFIDGMRDYGNYTRDPFNTEKIDVVKGPSSVGFGRGSTGGAVNQESKQAGLEDITDVQLAIATDATKRATVDVNRAIKGMKGAAFRLNMMTHDNNVAERDFVQNKRFGFAPTVSFGIGSETRTTLSYLHQTENNIPDYGLPWIGNRVADESDGIKRSNYYGFKDGSNFLKTNVDMATAKVEHDINENTMFRQQVRFANNQRSLRATRPVVSTSTPTTVTRTQLANDSTETMLDSQTSIQTKFNTGKIKHNFIGGLELIRETSSPIRLSYSGVSSTTLANPSNDDYFSGTASVTSNTHVTTNTQAIYVNDTISPTEKIDVILGGRIDRFSVDYNESVANSTFTRTDVMPSVRSSFIYKPRKDSSVYANYGTSYNPSAETFSFSSGSQNVEPEKNETYEIGTKWGFFKNKLNTMFALFQTTKTNARTADPTNSTLTVNGGTQRVRGFEAQANGDVTEKLQIFTSYAYMDSEVIASTVTNTIGNALTNTPKHTLNLWASYKITPKFEFGLGANGVSQRAANIAEYNASGTALTGTNGSTNGYVRNVEGYVTYNAMAKYQATPKVSMQLNIYNLTNRFYYDQVNGSQVVPGAGRSILLTTNIKLD